jgi:phosphoheptose isomerase
MLIACSTNDVFRAVGRERDERRRCGSCDTDGAFAALVASAEGDGAFFRFLGGFGEDAQVLLGVATAGDSADVINAEFCLDRGFGGAF